jgi:hypothetical protein
VCRDFTHLAITLCRCMNIPARYTTGYLGDIGVPAAGPMDFSAWFEVFLGDRWYTSDARHNTRRIGRIVMARGRDAGDVPITMCFGPSSLLRFDVVTDEVVEPKAASPRPRPHFTNREGDIRMATTPSKDQVQGEGDYDAGRRYDKASREFAESGKVEPAARDARPTTRAKPKTWSAPRRRQVAREGRGPAPQPRAKPGA